MAKQTTSFQRVGMRLQVLGLSLLLFLTGTSGARAQLPLLPVDQTRVMYPSEWGVENSVGLAYSSELVQFFSFDATRAAGSDTPKNSIVAFTPYEEFIAIADLPTTDADTANLAFDDGAQRLLLLNHELTELIQVGTGASDALDVATKTHFAISHLGLQSAEGMTVDNAGQGLFILDSAGAQLVRLELVADLGQAALTTVPLSPDLDPANLRGLALNPANHHLYLLHPSRQILYELEQDGNLAAMYDFSTLPLRNPRALVFAPSADRTDDAQIMHLFIADGGPPENHISAQASLHQLYISLVTIDTSGEPQLPLSRIFEVTLDTADAQVNAAGVDVAALTLIRTIDTSGYPSPDPSGIDYIEATGQFLMSDGEIDEIDGVPPPEPTLYAGYNLYVIGGTLPNSLVYTGTTLPFSNEPVGITYNAVDGHVFISDDDKKRIFEVDPGPDAALFTADDIVTSFSITPFGSVDPEGLDHGVDSSGVQHLFIGDGINNEVYDITPGPNGRFDGVAAGGGDDIVTHFDSASLCPPHPPCNATNRVSIHDPEGIYFNPASQTLIIASNHTEEFIFEVQRPTTFDAAGEGTGQMVRMLDISAAVADNPSAVAMAPSSDPNDGANVMSYYIPDRMEDNNDDPNENDGRIYEFVAPQQGTSDLIFVSSTSGGQAASVKFADEDVLVYDLLVKDWAIYLDGSDVGLGTFDIDAFSIIDFDGNGAPDSILLSFAANGTIPALGAVSESDIVRFVPTSTGPVTAGTFAPYFDGSDVELTLAAEDVDAAALLGDGTILVSALGNPTVTGAATVKDEDILRFTPTNVPGDPGIGDDSTTGTWAYYFDGSDVGLSQAATEDVNGVWVDPANGDIYLSTTGAFSVTGVAGDGADIFVCDPSSIGLVTACAYRSYWDGSANGFGDEIVDAFFILRDSPQASSAMMAALQAVEHTGEGDDPNADPNEGPDDVPDDAANGEYHLFLPLARD